MDKDERLEGHQKFKELAALARPGELSDSERQELHRHLRVCASCQEAYAEYSLIDATGMPFLAAVYGQDDVTECWDEGPSRARLLASVREENQGEQRFGTAVESAKVIRMGRAFLPSRAAQLAVAAAAACLLITVAVGAYRWGGRARLAHEQTPLPSTTQSQDLSSDKKAADDLLAVQTADISRLQRQILSSQQEIARLRDAFHAAESRSAALSTAKEDREKEFRQVSAQRDKLSGQLHDAELAYQLVQAELTTLRTEHERVLLRAASLESRVDELTASAREQERRLKDDEQYLSSDRDIRELMGARKLYIADVFDVDSGSRTRKPFGRVFYTQSKSLVFYAFDLDHGPGVKNASAFQVWGQKDAEAGIKNRATNLGILYMDSESNRRWILRLDDPKQLAEIDAVFVTVEPHGGSQKPTGKPFLYALLRGEANHP
jgi:TolA-binding protein